jgi:hypothetical protein
VVAIVGIIYLADNWRYSATVESQEARNKLKDDEIVEYKDKLNGATPEEAKKRLDALELQVKALSPRWLTNEQKTRIAHTITDQKAAISIARDTAVADAAGYTHDLAEAFQEGGWHVRLPMITGIGFSPPTGIGLLVADPKTLSPQEEAAKRALEAAKIEFDIQFKGVSPKELVPDVELITTKSKN